MEKMNFEKMNEVWSRVAGISGDIAACRSGQNAQEQICRFIGNARELSSLYNMLSKKCAAKSAVFRRLSADECRNIRRLQTAYFILTGDTCAVSGGGQKEKPLLDMLRDAYLAENRSFDAYRRAAIESKSGDLTELFSVLADAEAGHAAVLRDMISELMN